MLVYNRKLASVLQIWPQFILKLMLMLAQFEGASENLWRGSNRLLLLHLHHNWFRLSLLHPWVSFIVLIHCGSWQSFIKLKSVPFERVRSLELASILLILNDEILQILALISRHWGVEKGGFLGEDVLTIGLDAGLILGTLWKLASHIFLLMTSNQTGPVKFTHFNQAWLAQLDRPTIKVFVWSILYYSPLNLLMGLGWREALLE